MTLTVDKHFVPKVAGTLLELLRATLDFLDLLPVHSHDAQHRLAILFVIVEGSDGRGQLGTGVAGGPMQNRRNGTAQTACLV